MRQISRVGALLAATAALVLAAQGAAAPPTTTVSMVYSVGSLSVPGAVTGLVLTDGQSVTATATGEVCPGTGYCATPDGHPSVDTTQSAYGGFVLPGAPAYGLVARVGAGPWVHVGSGPTTLSGSGGLVLAFNDDHFSDNEGSFTVTVSYTCRRSEQCDPGLAQNACFPGHGYGDVNHDHTGPPGLGLAACWPGHGYGDTNHDHTGPPGQGGSAGSSAGSSSKGGKGRP